MLHLQVFILSLTIILSCGRAGESDDPRASDTPETIVVKKRKVVAAGTAPASGGVVVEGDFIADAGLKGVSFSRSHFQSRGFGQISLSGSFLAGYTNITIRNLSLNTDIISNERVSVVDTQEKGYRIVEGEAGGMIVEFFPLSASMLGVFDYGANNISIEVTDGGANNLAQDVFVFNDFSLFSPSITNPIQESVDGVRFNSWLNGVSLPKSSVDGYKLTTGFNNMVNQ